MSATVKKPGSWVSAVSIFRNVPNAMPLRSATSSWVIPILFRWARTTLASRSPRRSSCFDGGLRPAFMPEQ